LQNIDQRIAAMGAEHLPIHLRAKAVEVIRHLKRRHGRLEEATQEQIVAGSCDDALDASTRCVSPSDFGFHNALRTPSGVKFLDFEFAGWDDPTKLVADFYLQPRVPVRPRKEILSDAMPSSTKGLAARYSVLFPILELKWRCIILALLDPKRWAQAQNNPATGAREDALRAKILSALRSFSKD